jgi:hypothetical protein
LPPLPLPLPSTSPSSSDNDTVNVGAAGGAGATEAGIAEGLVDAVAAGASRCDDDRLLSGEYGVVVAVNHDGPASNNSMLSSTRSLEASEPEASELEASRCEGADTSGRADSASRRSGVDKGDAEPRCEHAVAIAVVMASVRGPGAGAGEARACVNRRHAQSWCSREKGARVHTRDAMKNNDHV